MSPGGEGGKNNVTPEEVMSGVKAFRGDRGNVRKPEKGEKGQEDGSFVDLAKGNGVTGFN